MSRCELTVKNEFDELTEKTMRTSHFKANAIMKAAVLVASMLLFGVSASFGQQTVNLTAAPTTTTLPDGTTVPMWGFFCGTAATGATATCAALNPLAVATTTTPAPWSPVVITVPYVAAATGGSATSLTINLTNNLSFAPAGTTTANVPTSIVIVGQVGGGLGVLAQRTTTTSPDHSNAQGCVTWFIADPTNTPPGVPCPQTSTSPVSGAYPPTQGPRVQSFSTEVAAVPAGTVASTALTWSALRPGTYLLESGTHPSIQVPMGLIGVLVVTQAPAAANPTAVPPVVAAAGTAYPAVGTAPAVPYNAELPLEFSEIDPVQNKAVNTAVNTAGFSETKVWDGHIGACGNPNSGAGIANTCYPPAVNYTPFYYLINGVAFNKTNAALSNFPAAPATGVTAGTGTVLARLVNAGLRMHVPSIVGSQTAGFSGAGASATVGGFTLVAEDGNVVPNLLPNTNLAGQVAAPKVQTDVFMAAGKVYDVMINAPATATSLPIYDRQLSLSGNSSERDAGMLAYISVNGALLPTFGAGIAGTPVAVADSYPSLVACPVATPQPLCTPLVVSDVSKGVMANDSFVYGVELSVGPTAGMLACGSTGTTASSDPGLCANGTFIYTPNPGTTMDSFSYCANGTTTVCATVTLSASTNTSTITMNNITYTAKTAGYIKIAPPGVLSVDSSTFPLTVVTTGTSAPTTTCTSLSIQPDGGFIATASATTAGSCTINYTATNTEGTTGAAVATINFPAPSNLSVKVVDGVQYKACGGDPSCIAGLTPITDYRWLIQEDKTFYVNPACATTAGAAGGT